MASVINIVDKMDTELLAGWRLENGLSQETVAQKLGISQGHLSHLEWGTRAPSRKLMFRISEITGIPVARLLDAFRGE